MTELKARWPFARFPLLVDDGRTIVESTIIVEHLMLNHGGRVRWLPADPLEALEVRFLDRFFDNDVMTAMQRPVFEAIRKDNARKDEAMAEATRSSPGLHSREPLTRRDRFGTTFHLGRRTGTEANRGQSRVASRRRR